MIRYNFKKGLTIIFKLMEKTEDIWYIDIEVCYDKENVYKIQRNY